MSAARPLSWCWHLRDVRTLGKVRAAGPLVQSPLNGAEGVYCAWSVRRRLLREGRDDLVTGEEIGSFSVDLASGNHPVDLDQSVLHLSDASTDAWTARWDGLPPDIQARVTEELADVLPDALYHCHHVLLKPGATVAHVPEIGLLTDLEPSAGVRWAARVAWHRVLPGAILLGLSGLLNV